MRNELAQAARPAIVLRLGVAPLRSSPPATNRPPCGNVACKPVRSRGDPQANPRADPIILFAEGNEFHRFS